MTTLTSPIHIMRLDSDHCLFRSKEILGLIDRLQDVDASMSDD